MIKYILIVLVLLSCNDKKIEKAYKDGYQQGRHDILIWVGFRRDPPPIYITIHDTIYRTKVKHDTVYAEYYQDLGIDTANWGNGITIDTSNIITFSDLMDTTVWRRINDTLWVLKSDTVRQVIVPKINTYLHE